MKSQMMRCCVATAVLVVQALTLAWSAHAQTQGQTKAGGAADSVAESESYASQAFEAYRRGEVSEAIALYLKALDASPSANILYNLAKIYDLKVRDRELAMSFYRRYIADPGADPERVRQVNERLVELRELELAAKRPEAATASDRSSPGYSQQPSRDSAGDPRGKAGFSAAASSAPAEEGGMSTLRVAGLIVGGVGVISLGAGAAFGLAARSANRDASCDGNACVSPGDVSRAEDAQRAATLSTVATVAGVALAAGGTVMYFLGGNQERSSSDGTLASLRVQPLLAPNLIGSHLSARW